LKIVALPVLVLLAGALALSLAQAGSEDTREKVIERAGALLRSGPGNYHSLLEVLDSGTRIVPEDSAAGWIKVRALGVGQGWISANVLQRPGGGGEERIFEVAQREGLREVSRTAIGATIKGLSPRMGLDPERVAELVWVPGFEEREVDEFRGSLEPLDEGRPLPARERGLELLPRALAAAPLLAAQQLELWGGEREEFEAYTTQVLLWLAERAGAGELAPRVFVARRGDTALSFPGGWIVLGAELFKRLRDEAELAGVLGHELAHAILHHGRATLDREAWRRGAEDFFEELDRETGGPSREELELEAFAAEALERSRRRWERGFELGADSLATVWLARAGYDAGALKRFLERLQDEFSGRLTGRGKLDLGWLGTREELQERIERLDEVLDGLGRRALRGRRHALRFAERTGE